MYRLYRVSFSLLQICFICVTITTAPGHGVNQAVLLGRKLPPKGVRVQFTTSNLGRKGGSYKTQLLGRKRGSLKTVQKTDRKLPPKLPCFRGSFLHSLQWPHMLTMGLAAPDETISADNLLQQVQTRSRERPEAIHDYPHQWLPHQEPQSSRRTMRATQGPRGP